MRNCWSGMAAVVILASTLFPVLTRAQARPASAASAVSNPHDLSGYWEFFNRRVPQGLYASPSKDPPPMTEWAQARYDAAKPGYGPKAGAEENDPILLCTPSGVPRIMFYPQPINIVQTPDRTFIFFEREHEYREIWTDGRGHPPDPDPTWMGHSIGRWEGDTFIVDSVGFNDRAWLDFFGHPRSEQMHLIERFRRLDENTLSWQFTVIDPKAYTKPWESDTKYYTALRGKAAFMEELPCVWEDENAFTKNVREPAIEGTKK